MPDGVDVGGASNVLTDDVHFPHAVGVNFKHALVEVQKIGPLGGVR